VGAVVRAGRAGAGVSASRILFRVDGGTGVGLGHLQRCLSLAAAAAARGATAEFAVNRDPIAIDRVRAAGWSVTPVTAPSWSSDDLNRLLELARERGVSIVVVDSDLDPPDYLGRVREAGLFACAIDDNSCDDVRAHVVINGDAHAKAQRYRAITADATFLLGPEYALVAPGFTDGVDAPRVPPRSALLALGGSDPCRLMPALIHGVAALAVPLAWEIVIGPFAALDEATARALASVVDRATVEHGPRSLRDSIARSDIALTAAGQTLYEMAALGRPAVAIAVAGNQEPQLDAFVRQGAVVSAGRAGDGDAAARAVALLAGLVAHPARLAAMSDAGRRFIDGRGAFRAADALLALAAAPRA
jgi:UDP-2,4-diacetamido-2,4,6-trideoxy-beta-L-altropyranose hydrolase